MTHASRDAGARHDTLASVTGKSGRGTARQTIRVDEESWEEFGAASESVGTDRSALIRDFMRWFVRKPGAKLPKRPAAPSEG
jgi:hypothetical protein